MHESDQDQDHPITAPEVRDADVRRRRSRRRRAWLIGASAAVIATAGIVSAVVVAADWREEARPRRVQVEVDAPQDDETDVPVHTDDSELVDLVRQVLDTSTSAEDRAALVEPTPSGQPDPVAIFASFDGLSDRVGADMGGAEIAIERPLDGVALATVDVTLSGDYGTDARLTDVMLRRGEDGWRVTYESICGLSSIAPIMSGTAVCHQVPVLHRASGSPGVPAQLVDSTDSTRAAPALETIPTQAAYGWSGTARTGRWTWLVDYPEAEFGGGAPATPADLVRIDTATGRESGRVRLAGSEPELAAGDDELWVLQKFPGPNGNWQDAELTRVDPEALTIDGGQPAPIAASSLRVADGVVWLNALDGLHRYTGSTMPLDEATLPPDAVPGLSIAATVPAFAATHAGLLVGPGAGGRGGSIVTEQMQVQPLALPPGPLVSSGDTPWLLETGSGLLHRLDAVGQIQETNAAPLGGSSGLSGGGGVWGDGDGGLWIVGDGVSRPDNTCCRGFQYSITSRPTAVHLDGAGRVTDTWWMTNVSAMGQAYFDRAGDGLGWISDEGVQLIAR